MFFFWKICSAFIIWNVFSAFIGLWRTETAAATNQNRSAKPGPEETSAGEAASFLINTPQRDHITSVLWRSRLLSVYFQL